jgi:hypothetical protein
MPFPLRSSTIQRSTRIGGREGSTLVKQGSKSANLRDEVSKERGLPHEDCHTRVEVFRL